MKVQICSLEALERLIGGDNEMEIDIRNSVVQAFVNKYLKGVANETMVSTAKTGVEKYVKESLLEDSSYYHVDLKPEIKERVRGYINTHVDTLVSDKIHEAVYSILNDRLNETDIIQAKIDNAITSEINKRVLKKTREIVELALKTQ